MTSSTPVGMSVATAASEVGADMLWVGGPIDEALAAEYGVEGDDIALVVALAARVRSAPLQCTTPV